MDQKKPATTGSIRQSPSTLYRSYFRALYLSRLALVAFWATFVYFLVWAVPWVPGGLSVGDYTWELLVTLVFAGTCMLLGLLAMTFRSVARQKREALVAWTAVYDETTGLHNRRYFYDRLSLECERSHRHGSSFALVLLSLRPPEAKQGRHAAQVKGVALRPAAELVRGLTRSSDLVALISDREFAVLTLGVGQEPARQLAERIRQTVSTRLPTLVGTGDCAAWPVVEVGVGMYGEQTNTPESLVEAARSSLSKEGYEGSAAAEVAA